VTSIYSISGVNLPCCSF